MPPAAEIAVARVPDEEGSRAACCEPCCDAAADMIIRVQFRKLHPTGQRSNRGKAVAARHCKLAVGRASPESHCPDGGVLAGRAPGVSRTA